MKFGKEFRDQTVPEWQQAYMDYNLLKSIINDIKTAKHKNPTSKAKKSLKRKATLHRAFSGLTSTSSPKKRDEEAVLVSTVRQDGSPHEVVQTMFMMSSDEGGELELMFFRKLDGEFNKVLAFYRKKVEEVVEEADELTRQMDFLVALRIKVRNNKPLDVSTSKQAENLEGAHMEVIHEVEVTDQTLVGEGEAKASGANAGQAQSSENNSGTTGLRPASLEILDHVTINVKAETPMSTLKSILSGSTSELTFTKEQLKRVEELMKQAFVEFYHKLRLLKSYCFMNQLAFSKMMKKYDKITSRNASKPYLDMVDESYLNSSDEVTRLMERVEGAFIKHFSNRNRGKGMNILRPKQRREKHRVTFFLGLFFGLALALVVTLLVLIQLKNIVNDPDRGPYMENVFPLYSLFGFIVLHMLMVSANIYYWGRYKVNYPFIFNLKEGTHLGYRQVFLLSASLSVLSLAAVTANLDMNLDPNTRSYDTVLELVPLILLGVLLLIMICPLNIIYRSTRFFLIASIFRCTLAPLYTVTLIDFYMADQLTSQVQALRSLQFYTCYYIWGNFEQRDSTRCIDSNLYKVIYIVVAIIPYWMRCAQCLRRLIEEKGSMHAWNGLKYFSIIIALSARSLYEQRHGNALLIVSAVTSGVATIYATTWDLVVDWGLLQRKSKNRWLRDKLIVPNKAVYFVAIVLNCLLRLAWMQTVMGFRETRFIHRKAMIALVACLEIIRRGIWNFFRLENEHLNNVGKYRAFKSVPLPFNYEFGEKHS